MAHGEAVDGNRRREDAVFEIGKGTKREEKHLEY